MRTSVGARSGSRIAFAPATLTAIGYLVVAVALRGINFGDPVIHQDEQLYFMVGQRMLGGALPYVDIWDRKPLGLFLIYAAIARVGGPGVVAYQLVATVFAAAGAWLVWALARETAPDNFDPAGDPATHSLAWWHEGPWWAGVFYLIYLDVYSCSGGQAQVFYSPLVASAALLALRQVAVPHTRTLVTTGSLVMLLLGVALAIKQTVIVESVAIGLALCWHARGVHDGRLRLARLAALWIVIALIPTALSLAWYARHGHFWAIWQATMLSPLLKEQLIPAEQRAAAIRLVRQLALLIPLGWATFESFKIWRSGKVARGVNPPGLTFLRWWAAAALGGVLVLGTWYDHYMVPVLAPCCALSAPALSLRSGKMWRTLACAAIALILAGVITVRNRHDQGNARQVASATRLIASRLSKGCLYIYDGPDILYQTTHACLVSRYAFPDHMNNAMEARALGVDTAQEMRAILARKPSVVMTAPPLQGKLTLNIAVHALLAAALRRDYTAFAVTTIGKSDYVLYRRTT